MNHTRLIPIKLLFYSMPIFNLLYCNIKLLNWHKPGAISVLKFRADTNIFIRQLKLNLKMGSFRGTWRPYYLSPPFPSRR